MSYVGIDEDGPIVRLTLDRPDAHNALAHEMVRETTAALTDIGSDSGKRVLILTGAGDHAFCAGADMRQMIELPPEKLARYLADTRKLFRTISELPQPTIAAVNGHAHGGGAEIACSCDLRVGCERTTFRFPGASYGMAVGTWHLPTVVGLPKAKELLLTTRTVDAEEALDLGLLNHLYNSDSLLEEANNLARQIAEHPPAAVQSVKSLLDRTVGAPILQRFYRELYSNQDRGVNREVQERIERVLQTDGKK